MAGPLFSIGLTWRAKQCQSQHRPHRPGQIAIGLLPIGPEDVVKRLVTTCFAVAAAMASSGAVHASAQAGLEGTPSLSGGWVGLPWTLHAALGHRLHTVKSSSEYGTERTDLATTASLKLAFGLASATAVGASYALQSPAVVGERDEAEVWIRHRFLEADRAFVDLAVTLARNTASRSFDAEALLARQIGPVRLMGVARRIGGRSRLGTVDESHAGEGAVIGFGAVWNPLPRHVPLALAVDFLEPLGDAKYRDESWNGAIHFGIPHTGLILSLQATTNASHTLQGSAVDLRHNRYGLEVTSAIPTGLFLGLHPSRQEARAAVVPASGETDAVVEIQRYAYGPGRVVVRAGSVVEWVNRDAMVHTATAEDEAWDSGAIQPGASWRARFDRPGVYLYTCGPHPFMKGVIIVQ